ncbi:MAG: hypothetical protein E7353_03530 [Clostridiales bacterium]|nr:hypothetical protein [Clostridiales bacterium]
MENIFTKETKYRLVSSILFLIFAFVCRSMFIRIGFLVVGVIGILTCNNPNKKTKISAMVILMSLCALQFIYIIVQTSIEISRINNNYYGYYDGDYYRRLNLLYAINDILFVTIMLSSACCFAIGNLISKKALVIVATILVGVVAMWDMSYLWMFDLVMGRGSGFASILSNMYTGIICFIMYAILVVAFILNAITITCQPKEIPQPMYNYNNYGY